MLIFLLLLTTAQGFEIQDHKRTSDGVHPTTNCGPFDAFGGCTTTTCPSGCTCVPGKGGYPGSSPQTSLEPFDHMCGEYSHSVSGGNPNTYSVLDCWAHCSFDIQTTLCSGNGMGTTQYGNPQTTLFDFQIRDEYCVCDPGWTGDNYITSSGLQYHTACFNQIRVVNCNNQGVDSSGGGEEINTPGCSQAQGRCSPNFCPPSSCSQRYFGQSALPNLVCKCDAGFVGKASVTNQCQHVIRTISCNGRGVDSCSTCRRLATTDPATITCTCDPGFDSNSQCSVFLPCQGTTDCGDNGQCTTTGAFCGSNTANPHGVCCQCSPGYGGTACCPLQFNSASITCNGLGSCGNNGICTCPGQQQPGCCVGCDLSAQTCRPDGRCSCPTIANVLCGRQGGVQATCTSSTQLCACGTAQVAVGTLPNVTVTYGGTFCSPIISGTVCGVGGTSISTPHPSDPQTGGCTCASSKAGRFCCPIAPGQTKECGTGGQCATTGICSCLPGFVSGSFSSCEINTNCELSQTTQECRGAGVCTLNTQGIGSYLENLHFADSGSLDYRTSDNPQVVFSDEGAVKYIQRFTKAFNGFDPAVRIPESIYYTQNISSCNAVLSTVGRGQCLFNMLTVCQSQRESYIDSVIGTRNLENMKIYIQKVFQLLFPTRTPPSQSSQLFIDWATAFLNDCVPSTTSLPREAIASILLYEEWVYRYNTEDASVIKMLPDSTLPSYPYQCKCTAPTGAIGDLGVGGRFCQFNTCPVGGSVGDLQICSGYKDGIQRGYCDASNHCTCGRKFSGPACQFSRSPGCWVDASTDFDPCTNSAHGTCIVSSGSEAGNDPIYSCQCQPQYSGTYCTDSRCVDLLNPSTPPSIECNNHGLCKNSTTAGAAFKCECKPDKQTPPSGQCNPNIRPFISAGNACERNASFACGSFHTTGLLDPTCAFSGSGEWRVCASRGVCNWDYNTLTASCACDTGYSGTRCESSLCANCNAHQTCNPTSGLCDCFTMWTTPGSCTTGNRTCECSVNACGHGTPSVDGTTCSCDTSWKKSSGKCTVPQCSLVVHSDQGVRKCLPSDTICSSIEDVSQSLAQGCCVDSCPTCIFNATGNSRTCDCGQMFGCSGCYTQSNEICFPKCHGETNCNACSSSAQCTDCGQVVLQANQFTDPSDCLRYTCTNGVRKFASCIPSQQTCCDCTNTPYSGPFCTTSICGERGTPNANGTTCNCIPPFKKTGTFKSCNSDDCFPGTVISDPTSMIKPFFCNCPGSTFIGANNLSCTALDCAGQHASLCSVCIRGLPTLINRIVTCNCNGTGFTGTVCNTAACLNGGTPDATNQTVCVCSFPFKGQFCQLNECLHGGKPITGSCNCTGLQFEGSRCETAIIPVVIPTLVSSSSSSTAVTSSSSSSSSSSSTAVTTAAAATSQFTTAEIVGIAVGSAGGAILFGLIVYFAVTKTAVAGVSATAAGYTNVEMTSAASGV